MINLNVEKIIEQSGSTRYRLSPASFTIGGMDANFVDKIALTIPEEWQDKTVRMYFVPANSTPFYVLYGGEPFDVSTNMTKRAGAIVVDAIGGDYHAYTTNASYRAYTHLTPQGEEEPIYTPSQIEQFLAIAQNYASTASYAMGEAVRAKAEVVHSADSALSSAENAHQSAVSAEENASLALQYRQEASAEIAQGLANYNENANAKMAEFNANASVKASALNQTITATAERINASAQDVREEFSGYVGDAQTARAEAEQAKSDAQAISDGMQSRLDRALHNFVPSEITVKEQTPDAYVLHIKDVKGEYDTPNLKGQDGKGSGDMLKSAYDTNNDGVVNGADHATTAGNAQALNGHPDTYFATNQAVQALGNDLASKLATSMANLDTDGQRVVKDLALSALATIIETVNSLSQVAKTGRYSDLTDRPSIPAEVTETTVSGWGFTKNRGTYVKARTGIPKTDLASAVQASLDKADTALQSYTETDPTVPAWAKAQNKPSYTASEVGAMAVSGGTFTGTTTASETERTRRSIFNEETRRTSETGTLQAVKYFINVV